MRTTCPICGFSNTSAATFCGNCGCNLGLPASPSDQVYCSHCEKANPSTAAFCGACGRRLPNAAAAKRRGKRFFTVLTMVVGLIMLVATALYYASVRNEVTGEVVAATQSGATDESNEGKDNSELPSTIESPFVLSQTTASSLPTVTPFPTGTPKPTLTSLPISTQLPTVSRTMLFYTPESSSCVIRVADEFTRNRDLGLGCPTAPPTSDNWIGLEDFEHGRMLWRKDNDRIYVIYNSGLWESFTNTWRDGDPAFSCGPEQTPPTPMLGFGRLWCTNDAVHNNLGNATNAEWGLNSTIQQFENGLMMQPDGGRVYQFFNVGTWR